MPSLLPVTPELTARAAHVAERLAGLPAEVAHLTPAAQRVGVASDFVLDVLARFPAELAARLEDREQLARTALVAHLDLGDASEAAAMKQLRRIRQIEMARIAWRDLAGAADVDTILAETSLLADCIVEAAAAYAVRQLEPRFPAPRDPAGKPLPLLVLAMGKLGGGELNFSSDVDLVFLYPHVGVQPETVEAETHYLRVAQLLIKLLDSNTADGFAYRVDTRLRPFGQSGPLVVSLAAFEAYLLQHGRDWERYAYVKARLLTGLPHSADVFDEILTPFVYRRYLDFGVFDALRQMKRLISKEVARKDMAENIKLGPGGIREIEFIVQAFQLVRGGRNPELRTRSLLAA